jgi:hypothetical protein
MIQTDNRAKLRTDILRLSSSIPKRNFQRWDREKSAAYKRLCGEAQKLAARGAATEQQLSGKLSELRLFWAGEPEVTS